MYGNEAVEASPPYTLSVLYYNYYYIRHRNAHIMMIMKFVIVKEEINEPPFSIFNLGSLFVIIYFW